MEKLTKTIYVEKHTWDKIASVAEDNGMTKTELVNRALCAYLVNHTERGIETVADAMNFRGSVESAESAKATLAAFNKLKDHIENGG